MIIVSDAGPLNVLIRAGLVDHLGQVHTPVLIPPAVVAEMTAAGTPKKVRDWIASKPGWLKIKAPANKDPGPRAGRGEREAIALAIELKQAPSAPPVLFLVDDSAARNRARRDGLETINTLAVLELFSARGLCDLKVALGQLPADFKIKETQAQAALVRDAARSATRNGAPQVRRNEMERSRTQRDDLEPER